MSYPILYLKKGKAESIKRFHPWIFSGALQRIPSELQEGDIVKIADTEGSILAVGHFQIGSIAVRILSFSDQTIHSAFWKERLLQAHRMRVSLNLVRGEENNIYRLVHGEGDQLPGLVIDVYGKTAVVQAHSVGMHHNRNDIAEALKAVMGDDLDHIYYKSETTLPFKAQVGEREGFLYGGSPDNIATENGLHFHIDWLKGQKTGFFVDQRNNRSLLEYYANNRAVLNMFCYTGGFSIYALRGGATRVVSVDSSHNAIDLVNANASLNFPNDLRHEAYTEDAFKFLNEEANEYDLIVLDPPAFAKHKSALRNALKGYTRLNAAAITKIKPGGIIFTFSCSQAVNKEQFRLAVFTAAAQSKRHVRILHQLHQPEDHPINIYHPEGEYLKGLVIQVE